MKTTYALIVATVLTGCMSTAEMNDMMSPSLRLMKDDFDGAQIVRQPPVSAASSMSDTFHSLGFEWTTKTPDLVYLVAEAPGISGIEALAFNVDGKILSDIKTASATTEYQTGTYGGRSARRFAIPLQEFELIAVGKDVKMRVSRLNDYSVSAFGPEHPNAIVNSKLPAFIQKVRELRTNR
jgi:hypothetical protein